ncbi:MAG: SDR family oxidoreductase [Deltaproteobacteria bacterium]|nr:SDR family oxidoreductase [Deltaproteobacteria bacterium]
MRRVLVTGATGFVGRAACSAFTRRGIEVRAAVRTVGAQVAEAAEVAVVGDVGSQTSWDAALEGIDCVVHLAARVHQMRDRAPDPLEAHREVNVRGTERLARAAASAGVRRLVYMSSVKVMGEGRPAPYREGDPPRPADAYGQSKWEAEQALARIGEETGLQVVILRPPLVYGPGVRANFLRLMQLVHAGIPLPLGAVNNRRSLIFVGNLADAVVAAATHPAAAGETFFVSDGEDVSTSELLVRIGVALGRTARLLGVPAGLLRAVALLLGKGAAADRLLGSFAVDSGRLRERLGWTPPTSMAHGLAETARWHGERDKRRTEARE